MFAELPDGACTGLIELAFLATALYGPSVGYLKTRTIRDL
jgi:hypothetical protein